MMRIVLAAMLLARAVLGQGHVPNLEVSSVKLHVFVPGPQGGGVRISGNRVIVGAYSLNLLIRYAFDLKYYQVSGGPSWAAGGTGADYDITAKAEGDGSLTTEQARRLLQAVLAERFQLKFHRMPKEMPVYALVVGKNGPKLQVPDPDAKFSSNLSMGPNMVMKSSRTTMAQLASGLSVFADRPILDQTELTGLYSFTLAWTRDETLPGADPSGPSIFTAVQEQLGLKLESKRGSVDVLVIDAAERPSEN